MFSRLSPLLLVLSLFALRAAAIPTSYANAFVDPRWILAKSAWNANATAAEQAITSGASDYALQGPWTVTNKTILPPTNDTRTYYSFAPYWWANCSNVHNTTELTMYQVWTECVYQNRDGQFTPDQHLINDTGEISALGDAVLYASMAWAISGDDVHAQNINHWIDVWFVQNATAMLPNLDYAQTIRGVGQMVGAHTGLLDLKGMAKIATGVLTLRLGNAAGWTPEVDAGLQAWIQSYLPWVTSNKLAVGEMDADNNHGSFFFNQLASLYLMVNDKVNAKAALEKYFNGIYMGQIDASGEQPLEASRTHPYHYRAYNLGAVITNARIGDYLGLNYWNKTTTKGGTIQGAVDFAMAQDPAASDEEGAAPEMWQIVAATATVFGDPTGKYKKYLSVVPPSEAFMFWDFHATLNATSTTISSTTSGLSAKPTSSSTHNGGALTGAHVSSVGAFIGALVFGLGALASLL